MYYSVMTQAYSEKEIPSMHVQVTQYMYSVHVTQ